ncbi:MAG: hypothetical protein GFH27_549281n253 [Chloroflexi bacterium AL-W]|nr:hypothetical protein [Chloroflexi bacterium AL-N1]NOK66138.1 hypothetical protein [Chloroflexi bacterium AL-N10]NOK73019.1 hypothetical protein [Chloroflexi bacterium AL-N5]NOK79916.1 hypothetical protein [Chloroflexi bacterium AL-W]NOK88228.1 hypothetical protein [Chloroflexi bacterium AL-N15]
MKLVIAVIQKQDVGELVKELNMHSYQATQICSEGGFLRESNITLLILVEDYAVDRLIRLIREHCYTRTRHVSPLPPVVESGEFYPPTPIEVQVGGAVVFVLKTDYVLHL